MRDARERINKICSLIRVQWELYLKKAHIIQCSHLPSASFSSERAYVPQDDREPLTAGGHLASRIFLLSFMQLTKKKKLTLNTNMEMNFLLMTWVTRKLSQIVSRRSEFWCPLYFMTLKRQQLLVITFEKCNHQNRQKEPIFSLLNWVTRFISEFKTHTLLN